MGDSSPGWGDLSRLIQAWLCAFSRGWYVSSDRADAVQCEEQKEGGICMCAWFTADSRDTFVRYSFLRSMHGVNFRFGWTSMSFVQVPDSLTMHCSYVLLWLADP